MLSFKQKCRAFTASEDEGTDIVNLVMATGMSEASKQAIVTPLARTEMNDEENISRQAARRKPQVHDYFENYFTGTQGALLEGQADDVNKSMTIAQQMVAIGLTHGSEPTYAKIVGIWTAIEQHGGGPHALLLALLPPPPSLSA